jgi:UDP-N-acetylmuramate: L-alanyl-gamma-D-glutamyl-meso-diaminopimelate ligase
MNISELKKGSHIHMLGICGTAMASLAGLLKSRGFVVTGSDLNPYPPMSTQIEAMGIQIMKGYSAKNLEKTPDFAIIGNVIPASNEEAQEVLRRNIPYTSLAKAMGQAIIEDRESIVIAGTHGKTTTTSMMAWVAREVGVQPGFLIGGIPKNFGQSFQNPVGNYFVIEGDEYDTAFFDKVPKFIHYRPKHVIFTSCEFDHADIYKDFTAVQKAFEALMALIPENGNLLYWGDDKNVSALAEKSKVQNKVSYGLKLGDLRARILKTQETTQFAVEYKGESLGDFEVALSGEYNVLNALAVIGISRQLGWPLAKVKEALKTFQGVKRRQEILGEPNGITVIEDFAHHPTAVRETLKGLRAKYDRRKIWAVFEPRSATSRRKVFQDDYARAFFDADEICLNEPFDQSKIKEEERFSSKDLISDLGKNKKHAELFSTPDQIVAHLQTKAQRGDVIVLMSNGGFDGIYQKLLNALTVSK